MDTEKARKIFSSANPLIRRAVIQFSLPEKGRILIGASGGKDSTFLALLLQHLGYEVECLTVDLQYPNFDAPRIRDTLRALCLDAEVCDLRVELHEHAFRQTDQELLEANFRELDAEGCTTPCGACSRNKRIALADYAARREIRFIALGHHREDFLATLLKDYFVRQYYMVHGAYDNARFSNFVRECPIIESVLAGLCADGEASTMAVSLPLGRGIDLIRPMIFLPEADIIAARDDLRLPIFSSGCSHAVFTDPGVEATKRELVHLELTRRLGAQPSLAASLLPLMVSTLRENGRPRFNPRKNRPARLPGFTP
jgi:tRNA(Ile)-lysidine synthase TilS/MesJ